ncbi:hypothetical protein ACS0TY_026240 [Phlomoides rotata]
MQHLICIYSISSLHIFVQGHQQGGEKWPVSKQRPSDHQIQSRDDKISIAPNNPTPSSTTFRPKPDGVLKEGKNSEKSIFGKIFQDTLSYSKIKQYMKKHASPSLERQNISNVKATESDDTREAEAEAEIPELFQSNAESFEITEEEDARLHRRPEKMPISETGELASTTPDIHHLEPGFEILSSSTSQEMLILSKTFGLDPVRDKYLFSTMLELDTEMGGQPQMVINRSGCSLDDVPTPDEWHKAGVMNLSGNNFLSLDEGLDCPHLRRLFLQRNNGLSHIPSSFFDRMPALRLLDLSNTRISVSGLPASLFRLTGLQALVLRNCVCLDSVPPEVEKLKTIEMLDLSGTDLYSLPNEIGELTRLKHLELSFYGPDYGTGYARLPQDLVSPGIFSKMKDLEELSIVVHPEDGRWINIAGGIIHYIRRLEKLSNLQFYFPSVEALSSFVEVSPSWKKHRLRRFKFVVGHNVKRIISRVPDEVESKYEALDQCLRFINASDVPEVMKGVLRSVEAFYLDHHLKIKSLSEFGVSNFDELKFCVVRECPNFQVTMEGQTSDNVAGAFPNLEHFGLHYLWELERVWEDLVPPGSFKALKYLMVDTCPKLQYIASQSMLRSLCNLETFIIEDCESLKSIVKESKSAKSDITLLPGLTALVLRHLPNLATLGSGLRPPDKIISHFCPKLILPVKI